MKLCHALALTTLTLLGGHRRASAQAAPEAYAYCSVDSCRTIYSPPYMFFGLLPAGVQTHCLQPDTYAMTFDDGPAANYPAVLAILKKHDVKATFFVLGNHLSDSESIEYLQRAHADGHQISNHSFSHRDLMKLSDADLIKEIADTEAAILSILGDSPSVRAHAQTVRPPFGYLVQREYDLLTKAGYTIVRWNSDRSDWELSDAQAALEMSRFEKHLAFAQKQTATGINNSIIDLNHDFSGATLSNLESMILKIKEARYRFVTVEECTRGVSPKPVPTETKSPR